jgi:SMC interacting uncharacterized protein involved in chromosome segregation
MIFNTLLIIILAITLLNLYTLAVQNRKNVALPQKVIYRYIPMTYYQWMSLSKNEQEKFRKMFEENPNILRIS